MAEDSDANNVGYLSRIIQEGIGRPRALVSTLGVRVFNKWDHRNSIIVFGLRPEMGMLKKKTGNC